MSLILASTSTYRRDLLKRIVGDFQCVAPLVDEEQEKGNNLSPLALAQKLARLKAEAVFKQYPQSTVIGSDQVLAFENHILGKSKNFENAFNQLKMLSGKQHQLITAVCIISPKGAKEFADQTTLFMKNLQDSQIRNYLEADQPYDCAGSYKLESYGIGLFNEIQSEDHTAIVGLPLIKLSLFLEEHGIIIPPL